MHSFPEINTGTYDVTAGVHKITDYRCVSADMQHTSLDRRLYLHLDMNCFYAQVEQQCFRLYGILVLWVPARAGIQPHRCFLPVKY